ncbi:Uncharacterized caspase domain protein (fragment) [Planktothrix serta PCC 8927]|uniref:Uncharacterized caspase domain protein n=1 Tax=Planktothrix serta PCC 8927 TaxID=671068 RepID=A0A7Z9BSW5_9CYAN
MNRQALVVGINRYPDLENLKRPAFDAEAIAHLLETYGGFRVRRLPVCVANEKFQVNPKPGYGEEEVDIKVLEEEILQLFGIGEKDCPDTALLFFAGHGLRKPRGLKEGFLATSDTNPEQELYGLALNSLRDILLESDVKQQIIWLDCCHGGQFIDVLNKADPGNAGKVRDRCFIAACSASETAYATGEHGLLTSILLQGLDPQQRQVGKWINNLFLADFVNQQIQTNEYWRNFPQRPVFNNSGGAIQLIQGVKIDKEETVSTRQPDICPYKGLQAFDFNETDPKYFYGRTALTGELIEKVRTGNFLAVLGPSGSGKSSVVRAGLLYQLKLGQRLLQSQQWKILPVIRPGEYPLQSLAEAFAEGNKTALRWLKDALNQNGAIALQEFVADVEAERVFLVIDQFEEAFTLCQGTAKQEAERQQFFECLLKALDSTENKLCVVITMRADFLGKCVEQEYAGLAKKIQEHLVTVTPMTFEELDEAICEPAKQVGLEVKRRLVTQMIVDVKDSAGSLPLLQFSLTALWQQWHQQWQQGKPGLPNQLTLNSYNELGGLKGTLEEQANKVFQNLSTAQKEIAKWIFIELTQLGEDAEDTRRQVTKYQLVETLGRGEYSEDQVEEVIGILNDEKARLIVTSDENGVSVVDIAHEALIRHWDKLREWVNAERKAIKLKRNIEQAAAEWESNGKTEDLYFLLPGQKLIAAEKHCGSVPLSYLAQEFIQISRLVFQRRVAEQQKTAEKNRSDERGQIITLIITLGASLAGLIPTIATIAPALIGAVQPVILAFNGLVAPIHINSVIFTLIVSLIIGMAMVTLSWMIIRFMKISRRTNKL